MTKKQAIQALKNQLNKLQEDNRIDKIWMSQTLTFFKEIFGSTSDEFELLKSYENIYNYHEEFYIPKLVEIKQLLSNTIETVNLVGVPFKKDSDLMPVLIREYKIVITSIIFLVVIDFSMGKIFYEKKEPSAQPQPTQKSVSPFNK